MGDFFPVIDQPHREITLRRDFNTFKAAGRRARRKRERAQAGNEGPTSLRATLHKDDRTHGLLTQNVRGFGGKVQDRDDWLASFKRQHGHGHFDAVFLQETHVQAEDVSILTREHARQWGYRTGPECPTLSYWSPAGGKAAGVGVLLHPRSCFSHTRPVFENQWTPHFMALQAQLGDNTVYLVNIYAPVDTTRKEMLFERLGALAIPSGVHVYVGGDFNCTLHGVADRSYAVTAHDHDSPALRALINKWRLNDSLAHEVPAADAEKSLANFHARTHTYSYRVQGHGMHSCRLDRWYANDFARPWMTATEIDQFGLESDHKGVLLHLRSPANPVRIKKEQRVFPIPTYAKARVNEYVSTQLGLLAHRLKVDALSATEAAAQWDGLKETLVHADVIHLARSDAGAPDADGFTAADRAYTIRGRIADLKREWLRSKQRRLFREHTWWEGKTTKAFFRRISCKFSDNLIPTLRPKEYTAPRPPQDKANILADAWRPILQGGNPAAQVDEVVEWMAAGPTADVVDLASADVFTEERVAAALLACKAGKACGPDRLGNDWYREYADILVPLLTTLFKLWYTDTVFPASFLQADIFCLKKQGDGSDPLNYRPLALLNSDYKIFTRLLTTQVRRRLAHRINAHQHGFVPLRDIHTTIDYLEAAQRMATITPELREALVLLLDFAKAYDSLDRRFLYATLLRHGYPPHFVHVIERLHTGTTVRFLANGERSTWVGVTRGIRQGCPLAPLLFILALEPLYQRLDTEASHLGVQLRSQISGFTLRVAGYADDTALYLRSPREIHSVLLTTSAFGVASGLVLNVKKTIAIALHPDGLPPGVEWPWPIRLQDPADCCRYLGTQVGNGSTTAATWDLAVHQLRIRLRLASHKTLSVEQRSRVAAAIIVPKLLFIGRHAWPDTDRVVTVNSYIKNYVWHGYFGSLDGVCTTWLAEDLARLPRREGGLAVPDLKAELLAMAAITVERWGSLSSLEDKVLGDILFPRHPQLLAPPVVLTPGHAVCRVDGFREGQTLWRAGARMVEQAGLPPPSEDHAQLVAALYRIVEATFPISLRWEANICTVDLSALLGPPTEPVRSFLRTTYGRICLEWLHHAEVKTLRLFGATNLPVDLTALPLTVTAKGRLVRHTVCWTRQRAGFLVLTKTGNVCGDAVRALMVAIVANYPDVLYGHWRDDELRLAASPVDHPITACIKVEGVSGVAATLSVLSSLAHAPWQVLTSSRADALQQLQSVGGNAVCISKIHPHPVFDRVVRLWAGRHCYARRRCDYKRAASSTSRRHGTQDLEGRAAAWEAEHTVIANALRRVDWKTLRRIEGNTVWGEQVLHRLKLRAFSRWDTSRSRPGCPLPECQELYAEFSHTFWACPAARALWATFFRPWKHLGLTDVQTYVSQIFGLSLPVVPSGVWDYLPVLYGMLEGNLLDGVKSKVHDVLHASWKLGITLTLQAIWGRRCRCKDPRLDNSARRAELLLQGRLRSGYLTLRDLFLQATQTPHVHRAARLVYAALTATGTESPCAISSTRPTTQHVLFFDGGSRGNPGPGGSGSIILRLGGGAAYPVIEWMASVSYASASTTNNAAEYRGLLNGLRQAARLRHRGLHVVGDSKLIITHLSRRRPPKAPHLRDIYEQCRALADQLQVTSWTHHLRQFNKMADALANIAMDTRTSTQILEADLGVLPPLWLPIVEFLPGDIDQWLTTHPAPSDDADTVGRSHLQASMTRAHVLAPRSS